MKNRVNRVKIAGHRVITIVISLMTVPAYAVVVDNNNEVNITDTEPQPPGWSSSSLQIGGSSPGKVAVSTNGNLTVTDLIVNSLGEFSLDGVGSVASADNLSVSSGNLILKNGGSLSSNNIFKIGENSTSTSTVSVSGENTRLTVNSGLIISGNPISGFSVENTLASLLISSGAKVTAKYMEVGYQNPFPDFPNSPLFFNNPGNAKVSVSGVGTLLEIIDKIQLSKFGKSELTINNGAIVKSPEISIALYDTQTVEDGSTYDKGEGVLNIGEAAGEQAVAPGFVDSPLITFGNGDGRVVFNHTADEYIFSPKITGPGAVDVYHGSTTLTANNDYSKATSLYGGSLIAGGKDVFSPNSDHIVNAGATLSLNGFSQTIKSLNSSGLVITGRSNSSAGTTLTVNGDFIGNGGTLLMNTVLGEDDSVSDKLYVKGNVDGNSFISIQNAGGSGAATINGIEIVHVDGISGGNFAKQGRIVAGAYDYDIVKKGSNWYLSSKYIDPTTPFENPIGVDQVRPEASSYLANNYAANSMFITRLHDRLGEPQFTRSLSSDGSHSSMWIRNIGGHTRFKDSSGQIGTQSNRYVLQLGGDLIDWSSNGQDRWQFGVMAGYGNSQSNSSSTLTGNSSHSKVEGYSAGVYSTWYANQTSNEGAYLDTWMLYNWFDNTVSGKNLSDENYKSNGITASIESGYSFMLGKSDNGRSQYWLQPKAQIIYLGVKANNHTENNGTLVEAKNNNNMQTRLGLKAFINSHNKIDDKSDREFQPFIEANWIYNSDDYAVEMNGVKNSIAGVRNIGEIKTGVEGKITKNLQLWGNIAQQVGDKGYSDTMGVIGIKYAF